MPDIPVRYAPSVEQPIADEEQVHRDLMDTMRGIEETTSRDYGHAVRSVHAKSHGLIEGGRDAGRRGGVGQALGADRA